MARPRMTAPRARTHADPVQTRANSLRRVSNQAVRDHEGHAVAGRQRKLGHERVARGRVDVRQPHTAAAATATAAGTVTAAASGTATGATIANALVTAMAIAAVATAAAAVAAGAIGIVDRGRIHEALRRVEQRQIGEGAHIERTVARRREQQQTQRAHPAGGAGQLRHLRVRARVFARERDPTGCGRDIHAVHTDCK